MVTIDDISTTMFNLWTNERKKMSRAFQQKGGWENWLQVELAMALDHKLGIFTNIQRENSEPYGNSGQRVDILVGGSFIKTPFAIELKTQSLFQSGKSNSIGELAFADFEKIGNSGKLNDFQFIQFAVGMSPEGADSLAIFAGKVNQPDRFVSEKFDDTVVSLVTVIF